MTHLYYGDPNKEFSDKLADTLLTSGSDILEIGIPYTDPVCDGEIFQRSCKRALEKGITPLDVLEGIRCLGERGLKKPIYLTSYYAPIYKIGVERFVKRAKSVGVSGLIIPDLLLEEQPELRKVIARVRPSRNSRSDPDLSLIQFATVYSSRKRLKQIIDASNDFIYCISLPGVTGENKLALSEVERLIKLIKSLTDKKIYVGFGIKTSEDAKKILRMGADGIIVGSAIARIYEKNINSPEKSLPKISSFIKSLKEGTISKEETYD